MSTLSSANVTDVNLVLKERTHMHLCLNMLIFTHNLGNWLIPWCCSLLSCLCYVQLTVLYCVNKIGTLVYPCMFPYLACELIQNLQELHLMLNADASCWQWHGRHVSCQTMLISKTEFKNLSHIQHWYFRFDGASNATNFLWFFTCIYMTQWRLYLVDFKEELCKMIDTVLKLLIWHFILLYYVRQSVDSLSSQLVERKYCREMTSL